MGSDIGPGGYVYTEYQKLLNSLHPMLLLHQRDSKSEI